jgi:phosphatidylglycerophosphatase A
VPWAPGTFGTLAAVPLYLALAPLPLSAYLLTVATLTVLGFWVCEVAARDLGVHDHPAIVWDEVVGYLITMAAAPAGWIWVIAGFILFRAFDILKPWPCRRIDRSVGGGVGIVLDDVMAGIYAWAVLQLLVLVLERSS